MNPSTRKQPSVWRRSPLRWAAHPRHLILWLAFAILYSQWSWLEHSYQEHDEGALCVVCLFAATHDYAPPLSQVDPPTKRFLAPGEERLQPLFVQRTESSYLIRAPPQSL